MIFEEDEVCRILAMGTPYKVYFEDFDYHVTDGTFDYIIGHGDDDFEFIAFQMDRACKKLSLGVQAFEL